MTRMTATYAALALTATATACAPSLAGKLVGPSGEPVTASEEARVNIVSLTPGEQRAIVVSVDGDGSFASDQKLAPGPYMVEALVPGYGLVSRRVVVGLSEEIEMALSPLAKAKAVAIGASVDATGAAVAPHGAGAATLMPPSM